ncbi:MAG: hypothetical protein NPINA01_19260 [Nitrospinaceae bacterium]|nr:MAG: hypothetical protein NPINA01_19260 [Nitrospinaceae bacterium]
MLQKGKPEENGSQSDSQVREKNPSKKPEAAESSASTEFLKKKDAFSETLNSTLKSRFPIVPLLKIPPTPENFQGRKHIIGDVLAKIKTGSALIGLLGNSGVGKTTLGLVMADNLRADFPDEPIYVDMRGSSVKPLGAEEVMIRIIHSLAPLEKYPETDQKRTQLYRNLLKRRKSVLFLDNVPGGLNLTDLVPPKNCALIVTSIKAVNLPQMISKKLNALDPKDGQALLLKTSPRTGFWVNEIGKICDNFPLTLFLSAKYVGANPQQDAAGFVENLGAEFKKLKSEARGNPKQGVDVVLTFSYRSLSEKAAAVLRKLVLFPDTFDDKAEAFLCEDPDSEHLVKLLTLGVVASHSETNRFHLHDQVRRFLNHRLKESEKALAEKRFATYFLTVVLSAGELFSKGGKDRERGLNLFDVEWDNIKKGQAWALSNSDQDQEADNLCLSYTEAAFHLLSLRQSPLECIIWFDAALKSAKRLEEPEAEGKYLLLLGMEHNKLNHSDEALGFLEKALKHSQQSNDSATERKAAGQLGLTHMALGRPHRAIEFLEKGLKLLRQSEETSGEEMILENLGKVYFKVGENERAIEYYKEELGLVRNQKDAKRQGRILGDLGEIYSSIGDHEHSIEYFEEGLTLVKKVQDKKGEIAILKKLGEAHTGAGKFKKALSYYQQALSLATELKDQKNAALMMAQIGQCYLISGNHREATASFQKSLVLFQKTGDKAKEGETLWNLAQTMKLAEKIPEAIQFAEQALVLYRKIKRLDQDIRKVIEAQLNLWKDGTETEITADASADSKKEEPAS